MKKSDLQTRAEAAAEKFATNARKPVVIEFAGMPKAGKTTTLSHVQAFLKRCGFRVETVVERASVCPIRDKKHANFNVWTACTTLAQLLEKTQDPPRVDDPQILFLDRGLFDSILWMTMLERLARLRMSDRELIERFLRIEDWRKRISAVIVMTASAKDAMQREQGHLPVVGATGSIMNPDVLAQIRTTIGETVDRLNGDFQIHVIDTSSGSAHRTPEDTAETVAELILSVIEQQVREDILVLKKSDVEAAFAGRRSLDKAGAMELATHFREVGQYVARDLAEADSDRLQALPVVIIRNASGAVLRLRRKERRPDSPLHEKIVIWAGGHVRSEDQANGDAIAECARRELKEELRLDVDRNDLKFIGAIYVDVGGSTSKHVAFCYEWQAETDDVAVALSSAEFFERRGTSLSGRFASVEELSRAISDGKIDDPWSTQIVESYLKGTAESPQGRLL